MFSATSPPQIDYNRYLLDYINHQYQLFLLLYCCEFNLYSCCLLARRIMNRVFVWKRIRMVIAGNR